MPRFCFVAEDGVNLIQLQKNAFILNRRRRDAEHPHLAGNLKPTFDKYYRIFEDFAREDANIQDVKIGQCELTHIYTIEACEYWQGPQDTAKVIRSFDMPKAENAMNVAAAFNCVYVYVRSEDLQLRVGIRNGEVPTEMQGTPGTPVLVLEITAMGRLEQVGKSVADTWFDREHDAIIACFSDITNEDFQHSLKKPVGENA